MNGDNTSYLISSLAMVVRDGYKTF